MRNATCRLARHPAPSQYTTTRRPGSHTSSNPGNCSSQCSSLKFTAPGACPAANASGSRASTQSTSATPATSATDTRDTSARNTVQSGPRGCHHAVNTAATAGTTNSTANRNADPRQFRERLAVIARDLPARATTARRNRARRSGTRFDP